MCTSNGKYDTDKCKSSNILRNSVPRKCSAYNNKKKKKTHPINRLYMQLLILSSRSSTLSRRPWAIVIISG